MSKTTINDMTIGSPAKLIIKFMIPMCLGNLFQQFYNVVDSIVAGQFLGVQALAAIGSTGSLMFFVIGWLNGLTSGFAIMVAQSFGAKQYDRMRHYVAMSIYLSVAFALVMTIGFSVANEQILRLMNYSDEIMPSVKGYMGIIYMGLLVTVAYDALSAFLRALGDSRSPLYFLMISAGINVVLDIVLIVVMGMGVEGCAYATVIAQAISALLCFIYICMTVFVAFGATIATYVGQNRGAGKMDRVKQGVRCTQYMIWGWSVVNMIAMFFFGKYMTYLFISPSETEVIKVAVTYFHTVFWFYPFLGSIFLYRNTLQGMGYGLIPMIGGIFELVARTAIVTLVAGKTSFAGVCMADPAAWLAALVPLLPYYFYIMRKWKNSDLLNWQN